MKTRFIRLISKSLSVLLVLIIVLSLCSTYVGATSENSDTVVVVSLGDSYSSGEGIPEFYGQNQSLSTTVRNYDWLAHRSTKSWGSLLEIPGVNNKMKMGNYLEQITDFNGNEDGSNLIKNGTSACKWYFVASSGAETKHFKNEPQNKPYDKIVGSGFSMMYHVAGSKDLPPQLNIFDKITDTVDYVTLTVGGNDVKFADVITSCVTGSSYLGFNLVGKYLDDLIDDIWKDIENTKSNIKEVYRAIHQKAPNATIIVAGYPELLNKDGKGFTISKEEAATVNNNVIKFNNIIKNLVAECKSEMDIEYVDVASEFNMNGGHQAYSDNAWINPVWLIKKSQDLEDSGFGSAYSVHPNEEGAKAYARCVNQKIEEVESRRRIYPGTLSGKICKASDRNTPIPNARITVSNESRTVRDVSSSSGNYSIRLPEGQYYITIHADNYIDFGCYATVKKDENTYMETFLMVEGEEGMVGTAKGSVFNSMTGSAVPGVNLSVRKDWNNTDTGAEILASTVTDSFGSYTLELPYGNYTVEASKEGYLTSTFNIIVQSGTTGNQNGTITPIVDGDEYLITLTWGENPRDLDSHIEGTLSNGSAFHVYFRDMNKYDGDIKVCSLDYDQRYSYGPEHITLRTTTNSPYYYYIHRWDGSGTVSSSSAKVTVHKGNQLIATYNVPTNLGSDDYWNVFAIKDGKIIVKNTITNKPDTSYIEQQNGYKTVYNIPQDEVESTKNLNMVEWNPLNGLTSTMLSLATDETEINISPEGTWTRSGNLVSKPMAIVDQSGTLLDAAGFVINWASNSQEITQLKVTTGKNKTIQIDYGSSFELGHSGKKTTLSQLIVDKYYNVEPSIVFTSREKADESIRNWFDLTGDGKYYMDLEFGRVYIGDYGYRLVVEGGELYQVPIIHNDSSYKVYYKEDGKDPVFILDAADILRYTRIKLPENEKKKVLDKLAENGFEINI